VQLTGWLPGCFAVKLLDLDCNYENTKNHDEEECRHPIGGVHLRGDKAFELAPRVMRVVGIDALDLDGNPSQRIIISVERPSELGLSGVVDERVVEMNSDVGQISWTRDDELEMPLDVGANGITNDAHQHDLEGSRVIAARIFSVKISL
jgi:hypothetical protein